MSALSRCRQALLAVGWFYAEAAGADVSRAVFVDADVQVSQDDGGIYQEAPIAASQSDPNLLVVGAEVTRLGTQPMGARPNADEARIFFSRDAGARWQSVPLASGLTGGWDNVLAMGARGLAYFMTSGSEGPALYRSLDIGMTWEKIHVFTPGFDRPFMAIRPTTVEGPADLYIVGEGNAYIQGRLSSVVQLFRSSDGGKTFAMPVVACHAPIGANGIEVSPSPVVLSDGTIVVLCSPYFVAGAQHSKLDFGVARSTNDGASFEALIPVASLRKAGAIEEVHFKSRGFAAKTGGQSTAIASSPKGGSYEDRLYVAWVSCDSASVRRLYVSHSADKGSTWSAPLVLGRERALRDAEIDQAQPMLSVNKDGVVGLAWFDTRNASKPSGYDVYFAASFDGGESFTSESRVSRVTSYPAFGGNVAALPLSVERAGADASAVVQFASPYVSRELGGDYAQMAADAAGRFHPLWPDARSQVGWELYTSTIHVGTLETRKASISLADIELIFEPAIWSAGFVDMPVRLRNGGPHTITQSLSVRIVPISDFTKEMKERPGSDSKLAEAFADAWPAPRLQGKETGIRSDCASYEFRFDDEHPLFPGGLSKEVTIHLAVLRPEHTYFKLNTEIYATDLDPKVVAAPTAAKSTIRNCHRRVEYE